MRKNSLLESKYLAKNNLALFFMLAMMVGFLCSRSIASVGMFLFAVNALRDVPPRRWPEQRWYLLGLLWVGFYALSWFWSENKSEWATLIQVKYPYLFFPLAFGFTGPWSKQELRTYSAILLGCLVAGACYSLSFLVRDPHNVIEGYNISHTLPTPAYRDHISFSTAVAAGIVWCFYSWPLWRSRTAKACIVAAAMFLTAYLHILAAKTGLLALYLFLMVYGIHFLLKGYWKGFLVVGALLIGIVAAAYQWVPTFRTRMAYAAYSWDRFAAGERTGNYSDMGRVLSYDVAARIITAHPWQGVGSGDMLQEMGKGYQQWYPGVSRDQWILPHNQFLTVALAIGIPGMLLFFWFVLAPLSWIRRNREGFFLFATWLVLLVPLFTDPTLEVQFGVFVSLFFLLMQRSCQKSAAATSPTTAS